MGKNNTAQQGTIKNHESRITIIGKEKKRRSFNFFNENKKQKQTTQQNTHFIKRININTISNYNQNRKYDIIQNICVSMCLRGTDGAHTCSVERR